MQQGPLKTVLYIAASLDGYIARMDGSVDWLDVYQVEGEEDYGYSDFYNSVDALIMGSGTYEVVRNSGRWAYPGKKTYVLTKQELSSDNQDIKFTPKRPATLIRFLQSEVYQKIWLVGGGQLTASFLQPNLINEFILSLIPVCLGDGIPLFPNNQGSQIGFNLLETKSYSTGIVQLHYRNNDQKTD